MTAVTWVVWFTQSSVALALLVLAANLVFRRSGRSLDYLAGAACAYLAAYILFMRITQSAGHPEWAHRGVEAIAAGWLLVGFLLLQSAGHPDMGWRRLVRRGWFFLLAGVVIEFHSALPFLRENPGSGFTRAFGLRTYEISIQGHLFHPQLWVSGAALAGLGWVGWADSRRVSGLARLDIQLLTSGLVAMPVFAGLSFLVGSEVLSDLADPFPISLLGFVLGVTVFLVTHRWIFSLAQVAVGVGLLSVACGVAALLAWAPHLLFAYRNYTFLTGVTAFSVLFVIFFYEKSVTQIKLRDHPRAAKAREAIFSLNSMSDPRKVSDAFTDLIGDWAACDYVVVLAERDTGVVDDLRHLAITKEQLHGLRALGHAVTLDAWTRAPDDHPLAQQLRSIMFKEHLVCLAASEKTPNTRAIMVGLGVRRGLAPFTFLETRVLVELCGLLAETYERALLNERIRLVERQATIGQFGATCAHEIRNALTSIKTLAEVVIEGLEDAAVLQPLAATAALQTERIFDLAEELESQAHRPPIFQRVSAAVLLQQAVDSVSAEALSKGVLIHTHCSQEEITLNADPALDRCFVNLLSNAIEAASQSQTSPKEVFVSCSNVGEWVDFAVKDTGGGVSPAMVGRLFEPFVTGKVSGTGLGLASARKMVEEHGGTLTLESGTSQGAVFRVRLRRAT